MILAINLKSEAGSPVRFFEKQLHALRSRVWIAVRPTENDSTRLYKNGDTSVVISCSKLKSGS